jgi:hypothetical protein
MGISYQVEELVVPALAHVVGSGIMYVPNGWCKRTLCSDDPPEAAQLLDYFDSTYISGKLRQQNPAQNQEVSLVLTRNPPMFPPAIWNVHDARTNNMCEGWNNKFFNLVGYAHPSLWRVIEWRLTS